MELQILALDAAPGLPLAALVERELATPSPEAIRLMAPGRYLFAVYDSSEPSIRYRFIKATQLQENQSTLSAHGSHLLRSWPHGQRLLQ